MLHTMRWFGPADPVPLSHIMQAGATGIVTALHHIPNGEVWSREEIRKRKSAIEAAGNAGHPLEWAVVESVPVHEDIKKGKPGAERFVENYKATLRNLAAEGIQTVCYNFMPVLDWSRTDLRYPQPDGSLALRFHYPSFAAFDLFLLKRPGAENDYSTQIQAEALALFSGWTEEEKSRLAATVLQGLPGAEEHFSLSQFQSVLDEYRDVGPEALRRNLHNFLREVAPVAEEGGQVLTIHPDDPPFPLLGLPRIVSHEEDLKSLFDAVPSPANGFCFCAGSFGARPDNDLTGISRRFADRMHFLHLRSVKRDADEPCTFFEANHLEGDADMVGIVANVLDEEARRGKAIPMRPDHGHQMLDDVTKKTNPGYSAIGRLRGLAEIRGIETALRTRKSTSNR